jgi:isopenicillin N synthase-like dioxygenase
MGVYVSDTLEHLTNGYLRAGVHQVVSPISMKDRETGVLPERYSMAFFAKADRQANVGPLEKYIISVDNNRYFQDLTAIALHKKRVAQLYGTVPV